jgi:hypothetical protein
MRILLAIAALLAATPAFATDWTLGTVADDKSSAMFVDRDSIEHETDGKIRAWVFYVLAEDKEGGVAAVALQQEYDCSAHSFRRLYIRSYDAGGAITLETEYVTDWKQNAPGDQGSRMQEFICSDGAFASDSLRLGEQLPIGYARSKLL